MSRGGRSVAIVIGVLMAAALVAAAAGAAPIVLPRPGQVGVGAAGGYGFMSGSVDGAVFDQGPTLAFRLRYRMRYERSLGLSFESQRFEIRDFEEAYGGDPPQPPGRKNMTLVLSGIEFGQLFGTRTRTTRMLFAGAGVAQQSGRIRDSNETWFYGDGSYVSAGAGVEYFFMRSWAWDLSGRYALVFLPNTRLHDFQAALGVIFYASH
jgi:opacity protein-like surface antigen